jgi:lipoate-protein ligase A
MKWRHITHTDPGVGARDDEPAPQPGAVNMAIDGALFEAVQAGGTPVLRLYRWSPACLSLGRNQPARDLYDPERARDLGIDIVRRATGGLAVLHDRELTYSVVAPAALLGGPRATYHAINRALVAALARLGAPVAIAGERRRAPALAAVAATPCFHEPAPGEVVAGARKLVGSAQRCERHTILQHGSILLDGDQSSVLALQTGAPTEIDDGSATLRDLLGRTPAWPELERAIVAGFEDVYGIALAPSALTIDEAERADRLATRFRSDAWTWRR